MSPIVHQFVRDNAGVSDAIFLLGYFMPLLLATHTTRQYSNIDYRLLFVVSITVIPAIDLG